jgi:excisionase family DNA binding protein
MAMRSRHEERLDPPIDSQVHARGVRRGSSSTQFLSVAAAAGLLGISEVTLYRAISAGEFPAVRIRGRLIVPAKAIEAMADAATVDRTVVDAAGWAPEGVAR